MSSRLLFSLSLVFTTAASALAQVTITLNPVEVAGEFVEAGPRSIVVKAGDGRNWTLHLGKETRLKVTGTAAPEMLAPRACVRFIASIDKKTSKAQDKIDKITIFTPTEGVPSRTLGVELAKDAAKDDDDAGGPPRAGAPFGPPPGPGPGPGIGPGRGPMPPGRQGPPRGPNAGNGALARIDPNTPEDAGDAPSPKRRGSAAKSAAASVPDVASYEVCAQVVSFHGRRLMVNVQNRFFKPRITAELAPDAEIAVDLSDLSMVSPGDKVSAQGFYVKAGQCEITEKLVITLANPIGAKPGHARRTRDAKPEAERPPVGKPRPKSAARPSAGADPVAPADADPLAPADNPPAGPPPKAKDFPREKEGEKEGGSLLDDIDKPAPAPPPKPDEAAPAPKKPADSGKKPSDKDEEKDVFEK